MILLHSFIDSESLVAFLNPFLSFYRLQHYDFGLVVVGHSVVSCCFFHGSPYVDDYLSNSFFGIS